MDVNDLATIIREGGDVVSWLLLYMVYKQHHNSQVIERQERRITVLETIVENLQRHCPLLKPPPHS